NVTITSASLSVNGNQTTLSVTLQNDGNSSFKVFGLTLKGEFNSTKTFQRGNHGNDFDEQDNDETNDQNENENHNNNSHNNNLSEQSREQIHSRTLPFKVNGTSLLPLFGTNSDHDDEDDENGNAQLSAFTLEPYQKVTLTFSGVIALHQNEDEHANMATTIIPMVGSSFTLRLMGEGFQTFTVTAS
ncbi:MAG TPA: hypothetical protein VLH35_02075, partial [Candidatus Acidoferrales bacterium]|nr:hypothetical protein [Candidatus Acidoferrales bacterium]